MFERLNGLYSEKELEIVKNSTILVLGCGGVGGSAIMALARVGIGNLILIDYDIVKESNINRQQIAFESTIGQDKADVFKTMIKDINPNCNVIIFKEKILRTNLQKLIDYKADFIIDAADNISVKKELIKLSARNKNINVIASMAMGKRKDPTKVSLIDLSKTRNNVIARDVRKMIKEEKINRKVMVVSSDEVPAKVGDKILSSPFVPNVAGYYLAYYVIEKIIKKN